jgi:hypothetical protein
MAMHATRFFAALTLGALAGCNAERKKECDDFLAALRPLESPAPHDDSVDRARADIAAIRFEDEPLREYASSTKTTLTVLSNALKLQAGGSPPDGTDDLVKAKLKEATDEHADVARYCSQ